MCPHAVPSASVSRRFSDAVHWRVVFGREWNTYSTPEWNDCHVRCDCCWKPLTCSSFRRGPRWKVYKNSFCQGRGQVEVQDGGPRPALRARRGLVLLSIQATGLCLLPFGRWLCWTCQRHLLWGGWASGQANVVFNLGWTFPKTIRRLFLSIWAFAAEPNTPTPTHTPPLPGATCYYDGLLDFANLLFGGFGCGLGT